MGITFVRARISNPKARKPKSRELEFLVDTGAQYSVVPARVLRSLGIPSLDREVFTLADGTKTTHPVGEASFEFQGRKRTSPVVFAPEGATPLLGALTLESLALVVNPVTRELRHMRIMLARGIRRPVRRVRRASARSR